MYWYLSLVMILSVSSSNASSRALISLETSGTAFTQHILTAPKEYNQARKSASDRLQPQQGSAALSDTDRRTEHHRTDFICRIGMLAAQLLHREYQTPLPATGNRFVMGSCQYGYSFIPHRISH